MASGYPTILAIASGDGPTLTAAAAATALPVTAKYTFQANGFAIPQVLRLTMTGRVSCVITTPGTFRLDVRYGGTVIADTTALNMNIVAHTNVPWWCDFIIPVRAIGATANFFGFSRTTSSALILGSTGAVSGNNTTVSTNAGPDSAPTVGGNVDITAAGAFDVFFTQTVATGSFTMHTLLLESLAIPTF